MALHGLDSKFAREALEQHQKLLDLIDAAAGGKFSLADIVAVPYVLRLDLLRMSRLWDSRLGVAAWYKRVLARASVKKEILDRMTPEDHAPFRQLAGDADPWSKVAAMLS